MTCSNLLPYFLRIDLMNKPFDALDQRPKPRQIRDMDKGESDGKKARLAQALRANLQRRKQAARAAKQNAQNTPANVTQNSKEVSKDGSD